MKRLLGAVSNGLWWVYGHTYDGLLGFWPYTNLVALTIERVNVADGDHVLELGCGTGNVLNAILTQTEARVTGVDISPTMLGVARKKLSPAIAAHRATLVRDDILHFLSTQPDQSFAVVVSVNVLYAIDDQDKFWRDVLRVLRPGGRAVVTTSTHTGSLPIIVEHLHHRSFWTLLRPRLLGVFVVDTLINLLGTVGHYGFYDETAISTSVKSAGGAMSQITRCYGGEANGVNIIFDVQHG